MKKYMLTAVMLSLVTPAYAGVKDELCPKLAELAQSVMAARQKGVPLEVLMPLTNRGKEPKIEQLAKAIILEAYAVPQYSSEQYQNSAIVEFGNSVSLACYNAEE